MTDTNVSFRIDPTERDIESLRETATERQIEKDRGRDDRHKR